MLPYRVLPRPVLIVDGKAAERLELVISTQNLAHALITHTPRLPSQHSGNSVSQQILFFQMVRF